MKLYTASVMIFVAFTLSLSGFVVSVAMHQSETSDALMTAALFSAAASGIIAAVFTKKLTKSKQWIYVVVGGLLLLLSYPAKKMSFLFLENILKVSGGTISIFGLGYFIYLYKADFRKSKWIWFIPFILLGILFKFMYWTGGNLIVFSCLLVIAITASLDLVRQKNHTTIQLLLLVWQIVMCVCIAIFYFRLVVISAFIIGYIFLLFALVDILLQHEKNMLENNEFKG